MKQKTLNQKGTTPHVIQLSNPLTQSKLITVTIKSQVYSNTVPHRHNRLSVVQYIPGALG